MSAIKEFADRAEGLLYAATVKAERLERENAALLADYLRRHKDATDRWLALQRARSCITGLLARTPVRDVQETLAEIDAALGSSDEYQTVTSEPEGVEFQIWEERSEDEVDFVAQVNGPRETALGEAHRYAMQIVADGGVAIVEEVTRRETARIKPLNQNFSQK